VHVVGKNLPFKLLSFHSHTSKVNGVIEGKEMLCQLILLLDESQWIALDTEADSLHAYPEKLCLLQISIEGHDALVDPLAGLDLQPLWKVLAEHELIMHGADYDIRLLKRNHDFVPSKIFDTMLAGRLVGLDSFGLSALVEKFLGVKLEKGSQKANWAKRPLTELMEAYARNDTRYLKPLRDILRQQLVSMGRLEWHQETCAKLIKDASLAPKADENFIWRVKGSSRLHRQALAVLRDLFYWREGEATRRNRPPFFILSHDILVEIANLASQGREWKSNGLRHIHGEARQRLIDALERGVKVPASEWPLVDRPKPQRPTEAEKARFVELRKKRDLRAQELALDPTIIASKSDLAALSSESSDGAKSLMKWQWQLLCG